MGATTLVEERYTPFSCRCPWCHDVFLSRREQSTLINKVPLHNADQRHGAEQFTPDVDESSILSCNGLFSGIFSLRGPLDAGYGHGSALPSLAMRASSDTAVQW